METVKQSFPCREVQIEQVFNLLGRKDDLPIEAVFIHGGPSTGKTTIVAQILKATGKRHAIINLIECFTQKLLLETILNKLMNHRVGPNHTQPYAKCDTVVEFVEVVRKINPSLNGAIIVLDKAEKLRDMEFNLLPCFVRLRELCNLDLCVVLVSELSLQKFHTKGYVMDLVKVHFPQYTKDEISKILELQFEEARNDIRVQYNGLEITLKFFQNYLNVFLSVFYRVCRDLSELRYMSRINFVKYCAPVHRKECNLDNLTVLWRHISPILKSSLEIIYLRFSATEQLTFSKENLAQSLELPFYAKYLLIAAYLASYNPAKDDKRIFMKYHGKKRKTAKDIKGKSKVSEQLNTQLGPKPFSFDRLLAIFYAILDDKVGFNNNLLVQVSSLVELQLLTALSDNCNLDAQKYKCNVNFEFIQTISKMVGFNIRKYLSDFCHI